MSTVRQDSARRRSADIAVALLLLTLLLVPLILLAVLVRCTSRGPAVYRQWRVGRGMRPFSIIKFRSMTLDADRTGPAVSGCEDPRVTRVGRWLRRTRLDELPQLVNLLRGDMTLVGPRPEVERFLPYYTRTELRLLDVRPGIIGPGALYVAGRGGELADPAEAEKRYVELQLHPKLALDLDYLHDRHLGLDLRLVASAVSVSWLHPSRPRASAAAVRPR
ncbi:lipopolysaccharide/colanic/teichoic acid biosynthesis glycosyltransferase [Streptomyces sp. TLI_55]|uniref:sugar transferase n=1 Tax=Streptomyces sp. TLI_55 TaxID=1938861 RepID=UPI000BD3B3A6|nr:sugar transferase [Streptomyces sp. TLI_55]SNX65347.1 lipopolysaccharide/colanic/teichoic acid biosynthesis glycosyltransferase [Streptomyces sp. TLI_55]